jgi:hypothetical protein
VSTDLFPVGASEHRRVGFGRPVNDHDRRPLEWRNQHRARGMAEMMVKKLDGRAPGAIDAVREQGAQERQFPPFMGQTVGRARAFHGE